MGAQHRRVERLRRGVRAQFARQYAAHGHPLVLVARRLDRLQALAETLRQHHRIEVVVQGVDLSDLAAVIQLHKRLHERGIAIDILANNAEYGRQGPFLDGPPDAAISIVQPGYRQTPPDGVRRAATMAAPAETAVEERRTS